MSDQSVIVVGGGIAGLTSAALLAHAGIPVTLFESHHQTGGCAGTFRRGPYVFDVGATQVAGLEVGGIHERIFRHLNLPLPSAELLDPGCVVDLADGLGPICLWHDKDRWKDEIQRHFPNSQSFWDLCAAIHRISWNFFSRDPIVPPRNSWDLLKFLQAMSPSTIGLGFLAGLTVSDLLRLSGCQNDERLKHFLDLQLRLYSQEPANRTAALYGATVLQMAHEPIGLWHLQGSMQKLSESLSNSFIRDGGKLFLKHEVVGLKPGRKWVVKVLNPNGSALQFESSDVVFSLPPQCLLNLIPKEKAFPSSYFNRLNKLPKPSGALVFYGAISRKALSSNCPAHLQLEVDYPGSLFLSISREADGRAPIGQATLIASAFTSSFEWCSLPELSYQRRKRKVLLAIRKTVDKYLNLERDHWNHQELATPRSFAKWTGRPQGIVGGLGQAPSIFGPFGLASRTPLRGLWLCGDSIYPGEGTAGVSQSAFMACRQLMAERSLPLKLAL